MRIPVLPFALAAIALTFVLAIVGWWIAQHIERRRRTTKRIAETNRQWEQQGGARRPSPDDQPR